MGGGSGRGGAPGAGGARGAGGGAEVGGAPGVGGASDAGAGGATGSGGIAGAGGAPGIGGMTGAGGAAGSGVGGDCHTSITGVVYDPAGSVPLPNVMVYVPSATPPAITDGISCPSSACQTLPRPPAFASALTDTSGRFTLDGVPPGSDVPLVVETGKWRRSVMIPSLPACATTELTDHDLTRLPRNQSEGHVPRIALVTGHASPLECLLRAIGISDSEITNGDGNGRIHAYAGGAGNVVSQGALQTSDGQVFSDAYTKLFADPARLALYDSLVLSCEGSSLLSNKTPYKANLSSYADHGGRLMLEHLGSVWIQSGLPPWPSTAAWESSIALDLPSSLTATVSMTFPGGSRLASWLDNLGLSSGGVSGQLSIVGAEHSVDEPAVAAAQVWLTTPTMPPSTGNAILEMSFETPIEADAGSRCGRVDFSGMHVAVGLGTSAPELPFPTGCAAAPSISAQQRMWELVFFDTTRCVTADGH